jgi:hypothetical protein
MAWNSWRKGRLGGGARWSRTYLLGRVGIDESGILEAMVINSAKDSIKEFNVWHDDEFT